MAQKLLNSKVMRIKLLGYLAYVVGEQVLEVKDAVSVEEVVKKVTNSKGIEDLFYNRDNLWEGVLFILNGEVVKDLKKRCQRRR